MAAVIPLIQSAILETILVHAAIAAGVLLVYVSIKVRRWLAKTF